MKKALLLFVFCIASVVAFAQSETEHLKFMGIELNGTIDEFQKKLLAKGATIDPDTKLLPNGIRKFYGTFSGEKAKLVIYYNTKSKNVYAAKAIIERYGKDRIENLMTTFENKIDLKYGTEGKQTEIEKDDYLHSFEVHNYHVINGRICMYICSTSYTNNDKFTLHIQYSDLYNDLMNQIDEMDDL